MSQSGQRSKSLFIPGTLEWIEQQSQTACIGENEQFDGIFAASIQLTGCSVKHKQTIPATRLTELAGKENEIMHRNSLIQKRFWVAAITVVLQIGLLGAMAEAKSQDKSKKTETEKSIGIYLLSHTALPDTTVSDIAPISNPDRQLVQLTDNVHGTITLLDVSRPKHPEVLQKFQLSAEFAQSDVQTFVGNTTLLKVAKGPLSAHPDPAVAVLSFNDPSDPKTLQRFEGVTALWTDRSRELIYLSNDEGLWILEIYSPEDKKQEEHLEQSLYKEE